MKCNKLTIFCFFCFYCAFFSFAQTTDSTSYYTSVHYKGSANIVLGEELQGCQFNVISVRDSFLYVQVNVAGIEAGRVMATPDNFLFINKLQKKYYNGDYTLFEQMLEMEIDFVILQEIFNGTETFPPEGLELTYQRDSLSYEYPFFNLLLCEYYGLSLKLDVKKVTFNTVPEVSATIPKNYTIIDLWNSALSVSLW